jgi:CRISPR type I-D-associated protein Csc1
VAFIYRCQIELHDSLYFATREIGRLYETEPVIHNYALCYALGLVDSEIYSTTVSEEHSYRYFCPEQVPKYEPHLTALNQQGIYVTPGRSILTPLLSTLGNMPTTTITLRWRKPRKISLVLAEQKKLRRKANLSFS